MKPIAILVAKTEAFIPRPDTGFPGDGDTLGAGEFVAYAARVSNPANQMNSETYDKLLDYLQRKHHWSPFEMSSATIQVTTTRDIAHQILRHWSFRFQEFSQRYAEATKFHTFEARRQDDKNRQNSIDDLPEDTKDWWKEVQADIIDHASDVYKEALSRGIAKECARKVLPEGLTETTIYMTGNLRTWWHYLDQRLDPSTQKEHRDVAIACRDELHKHIPEIFS